MASNDAPGSLAIVTVTYAGDAALCRTLCESVDRHTDPSIPHYLIIDRWDHAVFESLQSDRRHLIAKEDILPRLWPTTILGRRFWLNPRTMPVRGWVLQQLAKLAHVAQLDVQAAMIVDSDVELVRTLSPDDFVRDGRVRMYARRGAAQLPTHYPWHRTAARLLDLPARDYFGADYITQIVLWSPEVVRALIQRIAGGWGAEWYLRVARRLQLSEYILYGVFAEHVQGPHQDLLYTDDTEFCHTLWTPEDLQRYRSGYDFGRAAAAHDVAFCIQSNLGLTEDERAAFRTAALAGLRSQDDGERPATRASENHGLDGRSSVDAPPAPGGRDPLNAPL